MKALARTLLAPWLALLAALAGVPAASQYTSDIDIYAVPTAAADLSNVLIVLDNTANWSPMFGREIAAMVNTLEALPADRFRVGLMMFTESGGDNSGPDGGYVRAAVRTLDEDYKGALGRLLRSLDVVADRSNNGKAGLTLAEAYRYFAGQAPVSGHSKGKTDYEGNASGSPASRDIYARAGNALPARDGSPYRSPVQSGCARNFIIYISNGPAQDNSDDSSAASLALKQAHSALGIPQPPDITGLTPSGSQSNMADEWARFMKASGQAVTTYTLDVDPGSTGQAPGWSALLASMAARSGGEYFRVDSQVNSGAQIANALAQIFNQIQSINSVFASASLPVSVNARGTYLNQVFMGMFRPDGDARPRWRGNLKQYRFGYDPATDTLRLVDAQGQPAISGATGFLSPSAQSYWSSPSSFWINQPLGTPASASDLPDGEVVEKGGAAQRLRSRYAASQADRKLYTCLGCGTSAVDLAASSGQHVTDANSAITAALLGVASAAERSSLIQWLRGADNTGTEAGPGGTVSVRPSIHGDVLHSRPAVVNYGGSTGVVVFYGANDGMLHAVDGNAGGPQAGEELWSFIPAEHLSRLKRLRANTPEVRLSTTPTSGLTGSALPLPRDYFVDGPISVYQKIDGSGATEKAYLYVGMRRGGRMLYAFDVSQPAAPRFLWKKTSAELPVLGQTWSEARIATLRGRSNPVLVMGAGYDSAAEDVGTPGATSMGNAVLVLDAFTGALLKRFDTLRSVAADVALIDSDHDGHVDRAYAADVGGNLYRIDFESASGSQPAQWSHYRLAALSGSGGELRKFFHAPDVVLTRGFAAVLVGSGDREKPLARPSSDRFFTVYDTHLAKGNPPAPVAPITASQLAEVGSGGDMSRGCFIAMDGEAGEKVVNAPTTLAGITYFGSNAPAPASSQSCSASLGIARVHAAPLFCRPATASALRGGGMPPSPVSGVVNVSYPDPASGQPVERSMFFIIGAPNEKQSAIEGSKPPLPADPLKNAPRTRGYWFLENAR